MSLIRCLLDAFESHEVFHITISDGTICEINVKHNEYLDELGHWYDICDTYEIIRHFLTLGVIMVDDSGDIVWSRLDRPCSVIQKAWRLHRLRTTRERNDLVLRGLSEYFWHPSRIDFTIKDEE